METKEVFETLLNEHGVAKLLCVSVGTVRRWRLYSTGPRYVKLAGAGLRSRSAVRYRRSEIETWLASRPTGGGSASNLEVR